MQEPALAPFPPLPAAPSAVPRRRPLIARLVLIVTLILGLWFGWQEAPREIARWYFAAAVENRVQAQHDRLHHRREQADAAQSRADVAYERAIAWNPRDGAMLLERATWRLEDGEYAGALADCDAATGFGVSTRELEETRAAALVHLKRFPEAVKEVLDYHQKLLRSGGDREARYHLNQVAYFRSLGGVDLPQALKEIDESLQGTPLAMHDAARLDTRGFILYRMGRYQEAIVELDRAMPQVEGALAEWRRERSQSILAHMDYREVELRERNLFQLSAVIYYHRALVLQKLNRWKEAQQHLRKATELLGRTPDESVF